MTRAETIARIREIGRELANEHLSDRDASALERLRAGYQASLDALPDAATKPTDGTPADVGAWSAIES